MRLDLVAARALDRGKSLVGGGDHGAGDASGIVPFLVGGTEILLLPSTYIPQVKAENHQTVLRRCSSVVFFLKAPPWDGGGDGRGCDAGCGCS